VRFPYLPLPTKVPVPSLGGASVRYRPIVPVRIIGPLGLRLYDGCLDCASADTIFPISIANMLGIDLRGAARGEARPVGGVVISYCYATVTLRLSDGIETCQWQGVVGFVGLPLRWALLGQAGFLNYFDTELRGADREVLIRSNPTFPGTRHSGPP
jgi:hypothetical protein